MQELIEAIARGLGWAPALVGLAFGLLGLLALLGGTALLVYFLLYFIRVRRAGGAPMLLPTLVEDVLDEDLRRTYQRSILLDDLLSGVGTVGSGAGSELGRALRKWVICAQAERYAAEAVGARTCARASSTHLARIEQTLDEAFALGESGARDEVHQAARERALKQLVRDADEARRAIMQPGG